MPGINQPRRSMPPYPNPGDTDQRRVNAKLIEAIKYLERRIEKSNTEKRLSDLEVKVKDHDDRING